MVVDKSFIAEVTEKCTLLFSESLENDAKFTN